ncbi:putative transposase [Singulisphaera sp. GP187]|uniref:transposase n=1 Tax=Singulisphaera sp. GP187 TaxID=1882752 RepID=UPI000926D6E5|nr:transposase [Singulisphaera sp. GP187]SIO36035.1 putative transposase [Singulisphaera sp. GP187]
MGRPLRNAEGGLIYHALNRGSGRLPLLGDADEYEVFERVLAEAVTRESMRLLAFCLLPDHFELVLWPRGDGDLSRFMNWLTLTHTQRWHARRRSAGSGHVYQGRFKSFPVQDNGHLRTVCRYVEGRALRAGLVPRAEQWQWGSLWSFASGPSRETGPALSPWPVPRLPRWIERVNAPLGPDEAAAMERSLQRGQPFGSPEWQAETASRLGLESCFRPRGRPKKPKQEVDDLDELLP